MNGEREKKSREEKRAGEGVEKTSKGRKETTAGREGRSEKSGGSSKLRRLRPRLWRLWRLWRMRGMWRLNGRGTRTHNYYSCSGLLLNITQ